MNVICLEEQAFYELVEQVVQRLSDKLNKPLERWVDGEEAMRLLRCKSTKLQNLRDNHEIVFSQPSRKIILYDRESIEDYLEKHKSKKL